MLIFLSFLLLLLISLIIIYTVNVCSHKGVVVNTDIDLYEDDDNGNGTHFALFKL